jgi:predicted metalloprotease
MIQFVSFVLDDVQGTWRKEFQQQGQSYQNAKLDIFTEGINTGCGSAESGMGPFYCPADQKVYIDLSFYQELKERFGAPGDFAQAYVLAHEVGHHVQHLLGIDDKVRAAQERDPSLVNELSVAMELQADCFAGVWGHSTQQRQILEAGDVDEALNAAAAVGDDRIQKEATGRVNPETWTHGSAKDRAAWFRRGFDTGSIDNCDTFASH